MKETREDEERVFPAWFSWLYVAILVVAAFLYIFFHRDLFRSFLDFITSLRK